VCARALTLDQRQSAQADSVRVAVERAEQLDFLQEIQVSVRAIIEILVVMRGSLGSCWDERVIGTAGVDDVRPAAVGAERACAADEQQVAPRARQRHIRALCSVRQCDD
jgi:hypothetical protein